MINYFLKNKDGFVNFTKQGKYDITPIPHIINIEKMTADKKVVGILQIFTISIMKKIMHAWYI